MFLSQRSVISNDTVLTKRSMRADEIQQRFPAGVALPCDLVSLCEWFDSHSYPISGCFRLATSSFYGLDGWFQNDPKMHSMLAEFGRASEGSIYALWLDNARDSETAPVVMIGSEGECSILADNFKEFLRLLTIGYDDVGNASWNDWMLHTPEEVSNHEPDESEFADYRVWYKQRFGLSVPLTGKDIVLPARAKHPDFPKWVDDWYRDHPDA